MNIILTEEQSKALETATVTPPCVTDPRTQETYVLLNLRVFQRIRALFGSEDYTLEDTYPAQLEAAMRAGWNDPAMDEYNDYDSH